MRPRVPRDRRARNGWQKGGCFSVVPLLYLVMATLPSLPVTLAGLTLSGLAAGPINPLMNTVLFERVPPDLRGRVSGPSRPAHGVASPLGGVVVGTIGIAATFFGIGLCYLVVTAYGFLNPAFRAMDGEQPRSREPARRHAGLGEHSR